MLTRRRSSLVALLALVSIVTSMLTCVAATDPTEPPAPSTDAAPDTSSPTVHAEMLAEHADDAVDFTPGGMPAPHGDRRDRWDDGSRRTAQAAIAGLPNDLSREVFGYLPYWAVERHQLEYLDYGLVSTIAYFSVGARRDGTLAKTSGGAPTTGWAGWNSAAMTDVISKAHARGVKVVLTVTMMAWDHDYGDIPDAAPEQHEPLPARDDIANACQGAQRRWRQPRLRADAGLARDAVHRPRAQGARRARRGSAPARTSRWRPPAEPPVGTRATSSSTTAMRTATASSRRAARTRSWSWRTTSTGPGRHAPGAWLRSTARTSSTRAKRCRPTWRVSPRTQLIWGVPYYGRSWTTTSSALNGVTCASAGGCQAASWASAYVDARNAAADHGRRWDSVGRVPWYRYVSSTYDTYVQGYYDDSRSLEVKYDLVKAHDLRGVGIWHLLMDGSRTRAVEPAGGGVPAPALHRHRRHAVRGRDRLARRHGHHHRLRADACSAPPTRSRAVRWRRSWPARWTCRRPRPITSLTTTAPPTRTTSTASRRPASPPAAATPTSAPPTRSRAPSWPASWRAPWTWRRPAPTTSPTTTAAPTRTPSTASPPPASPPAARRAASAPTSIVIRQVLAAFFYRALAS